MASVLNDDLKVAGSTVRGSRIIMPPENRRELHEMDQLLAAHPRLVDAEGNAIPLPNEVYAVLRDVVEAMQGGRAIVPLRLSCV